MSEIRITGVRVLDVRFPTSLGNIGSDAVNKDPDYSAAYCILETNSEWQGHGLAFTLGRGNELCAAAIEYLAQQAVGRTLEGITEDLCAFSRLLTEDSQFRWLGPEKGVIHMAAGALINAVWDLWAKAEGKPVWRLLAEMPAEQICLRGGLPLYRRCDLAAGGDGDFAAQPRRDGGAAGTAGGGGVSGVHDLGGVVRLQR